MDKSSKTNPGFICVSCGKRGKWNHGFHGNLSGIIFCDDVKCQKGDINLDLLEKHEKFNREQMLVWHENYKKACRRK